MTKEEQKRLLEAGLNIKEICLLIFLQEAPETLRLEAIGIDGQLFYELQVNQLLEELPILEVKERQLISMLKKLSDGGFINKAKSKYGFYFSPAKNCITESESCKKLHNCESSPAKNCITEEEISPPINILTQKSNINNKYNITNKGEEGISRRDNIYNNIPLCDQKELLKRVRALFHEKWPEKCLFFNGDLPENFNPELLVEKVAESYDFLAKESKFSLAWCIKNYEAIISGRYTTFKGKPRDDFNKKDFTERNYTQEELNNLFDDLSDVDIGG